MTGTVVAILVTLLTAGCASQPSPTSIAPGFLLGFAHGFIAFVAFIGSIFWDDVRIYAFPNAGVVYDLGFLLGLGCCWVLGAGLFVQGDEGDGGAAEEIGRLQRKVRRLRRRLRGG